MASRKKSVVQEMVKESLKELRQDSGFPDDPGLDADEITGPERFSVGQKRKDEVVIDSLLAEISGKDGYFIKLKKELLPNQWMLMKTIEGEWRQWADMESAVANIVKEHTKRSPSKWGSGAYRVEIACKGGMRGKGYTPTEFYINADEEFLSPTGAGQAIPVAVDANVAVASKIEELSSLLEVVGRLTPQAPDPAQTQAQIAGAFEKGLAIKAGEGNSNAQMMQAMMTGMMGMMTALAQQNNNRPVEQKDTTKEVLETLKAFGVIGNSAPVEKPKSLTETLAELKMLGLDLFKKDDPLEQVGKLKQIAGIAADFMGMSGNTERPSILEKIVDTLGPALPGLIKDAKDAMGNAVQVQVEAGKNIERAKLVAPQNNGADMRVAKESVASQPVQQNPQVVMFFNQLHDAVRTNNRMFYPIVYTSLLQEAQGQALLQGITAGTHNAQHIVELLQSYGDARFKDSEFVMKYLVGYVNGFLIWIKSMMGNQSTNGNGNGHVGAVQSTPHGDGQDGGYDVGCPICQAVYGYSSEQDFVDESNKECGAMVNGVKCPGTLQPMAKA